MKLFVINSAGFEDLIDWVMEPESFDELITTPDDWNLETLAVEAGIFKSKNFARSNGFCGEVPHGVCRLGTKKNRFWVWNPKKNSAVALDKFLY